MNRSQQREQIFKLLFRVEFFDPSGMDDQCDLFFQDEENACSQKDAAYIRRKYQKIADRLPEIDRLLEDASQSWRIGRMGKTDLAILRLAVYELCFEKEVPTGVAINEAVELAKKYGQDDGSGSFVNGVLARFARERDA